MSALLEILKKLKQQKVKSKKVATRTEFLPYNKSILTRVIAQQLQRQNILCLSHFSKLSMTTHFKHSQGPSKSLFSQIESMFDEPGTI